MISRTLLLVILSLLILPGMISAQNGEIKVDTSKAATPKVKTYHELITNQAITQTGLFKVHQVNNRYYFEIPDSLLNIDILIVNRIAKAATDTRSLAQYGMGYAGDQIGENVVRFTKGPANKIFLRTIYFGEKSTDSSENGLYWAVSKSNVQPIVAAFDIKAYSPDSSSVVIDLTDYLNVESEIFFFNQRSKGTLFLTALQPDKSFINTVRTYPSNIEISAVRTYARQQGQIFATYELNSSIILLPRNQMKVKYQDFRVGYFSKLFFDFDANPQAVRENQLVVRWRMEPREVDKEKYLRGELVEPKKPIVFYIDPATPKKWVPYLIQGVNDWQKAFEKAGFKNAIYAREAPSKDEDSTWSLEDARNSAIIYKPSRIENASGPNIHDPRTGEVLESHINWYHNIMQLLHSWYFIQASPVDSNARKLQFDDKLMGRLIRYVCSHEVGHTLGLKHNFGASSLVPVDSLRSKSYLEKNGLTPSIMDYARFNYVAQPGDEIPENGMIPVIGEYDEWAIEWGYRWYPDFSSEKEEKEFFSQWVVEKLTANPKLWYGMQETVVDPRCQSEDLGDNQMKSGAYGIKNLRWISDSLIKWTVGPGKDYRDFDRMYFEVTKQFKKYLFHAARYIGGRKYNEITSDQKGVVWEFVEKSKQKEAIKFLQDQLFTTPEWLMKKEFFSYRGGGGHFDLLLLQQEVLEKLISTQIFGSLNRFEENQPAKAYSFAELLTDLKMGIFKEIRTRSKIDIYRRGLQKAYISRIATQLKLPYSARVEDFNPFVNTDFHSVLKAHLRKLLKELRQALPFYSDDGSKDHLHDLVDRIEEALDLKKGELSSSP